MSNSQWSSATTYNPITQETPNGSTWVYYYIPTITNTDSTTYTYNWTNTTAFTIPILYVTIVAEGGIKRGANQDANDGTGGSGGGQVVLLQFNGFQPNDEIEIIYNENKNTTSSTSDGQSNSADAGDGSYCFLTYYNSDGIAQDLTQPGFAYYYNTQNYATGTVLSTITFSSVNFLPISSGNGLLFSNNTSIKTFYGGQGFQAFIPTTDSGKPDVAGNGGFGGGGSGGGGGGYQTDANGSIGVNNYNTSSYGGMEDVNNTINKNARDGGYTPLCMPDGTGTSDFPAGALLGKGGNGTAGTPEAPLTEKTVIPDGAPGDPGSLMVFYNTIPSLPIYTNCPFIIILLNGYYIITITGNGTLSFTQNIPVFNVILVGGGGAGGANSNTPPLIYEGENIETQYVGGGGGGGGATLQTTLSSDVGQISVNIGAGGISNNLDPGSTSITYGTTTLTAGAGSNGGNGVASPDFYGGVGGSGGSGGGNGGSGYGAQPSGDIVITPTNGTSVNINGITYYFGGGGAGGNASDDATYSYGGLGGGGGNSNGSLVNNGYEYIYTNNPNPPNPAPLIVDTSDANALYSNNGLSNSGGGGAGADAALSGSTGITQGYNGGSGVFILYFPATN